MGPRQLISWITDPNAFFEEELLIILISMKIIIVIGPQNRDFEQLHTEGQGQGDFYNGWRSR